MFWIPGGRAKTAGEVMVWFLCIMITISFIITTQHINIHIYLWYLKDLYPLSMFSVDRISSYPFPLPTLFRHHIAPVRIIFRPVMSEKLKDVQEDVCHH